MVQSFVVWARTKRYVRLWLRDAIAQTIAPLTDTNARLNYIGVLVVLFLLSQQWSLDRLSSWVDTTFNSMEIFVYSVPVFFMLNLVFALFRVRKNEKELGEWYGSRFVYHEPRRLLTVMVDENDNDKHWSFGVEDAEGGSLVSYFIETDRTDNRAKVELAWPGGQRMISLGNRGPMNLPKGSFRLPESRRMSLLTHIEPQSTATTVRVFMTGWEVGKGDSKG
jgi:hypothetical protein